MKKILNSMIVALFFAVPLVQAATGFTDVPSDAWYRPYVSQLEVDGIIDAGEFFRPSEGLNRAELLKMVIEATVGIDDYVAPANDAFDDVPNSAWFGPYIETAAAMGIAMGYEDSEGNLTGVFGPADPVTRAAAVKILVEAFDISIPELSSTGFSDVQKDAWFASYVNAARLAKLVEGYADGRFGPSDAVSRAEMAKMLSLALHPELIVEEEEEVEEEVEEETEEEEEEEEEMTFEPIFEANVAALESGVIQPNEKEHFVASYTFEGKLEGFDITTLTIVNDLTGDTLGDDAEGTFAVQDVILRYPDKEGFDRMAKTELGSDGTAKFSQLDFFAGRGEETPLEVYAVLNSFAEVGEQLSGETFRLGIANVNSDINTFKAIGEFSGNVVTSGNGFLQTPASNIEEFTVRESSLNIERAEGLEVLFNGSNDLISLDVTASETGSVGLARLVFGININDASGADLSVDDFEISRNSKLIDDAFIYDPAGAQELSTGSLGNGDYEIIVSFDEEQIISAGETVNFTLEGVVVSSGSGDDVVTWLVEDDEQTPLSGLTDTEQPNTGKIFVNADSTAGIFTSDSDFSKVIGSDRNIIWSDRSADSHRYADVTAGLVTTDTGTVDWTNGYLLGTNELSSNILSK